MEENESLIIINDIQLEKTKLDEYRNYKLKSSGCVATMAENLYYYQDDVREKIKLADDAISELQAKQRKELQGKNDMIKRLNLAVNHEINDYMQVPQETIDRLTNLKNTELINSVSSINDSDIVFEEIKTNRLYISELIDRVNLLTEIMKASIK